MRALVRWLLMFTIATQSGCTFFRPKKELDDYEKLRREVNDGGIKRASFEEEDNKKSGLSSLSPDNFGKTVKEWAGYGPNAEEASKLFAEADETFRQATQTESQERSELFAEAAEKFEAAAKTYPDSAMEQDSYFMAGESYFFADMYPKANDAYTKLLRKYPNSRYLDTAEARRFSIAQYWLAFFREKPESFYSMNLRDKTRPRRGLFTTGVKIYDAIRIDDPTGKLADDATMAAAVAFFERGKYQKSDELLTDLRKTFPNSEHQFNAHFMGLKTKLLCYQGTDYSGDSLDAAEKLVKQIQRQFPAEAARERDYLTKAYAEIRFKKAQREWGFGQYYDRRGENRGARYYYDIVINDYSDTPFAEKARERKQEIEDEPDTPPQRLPWLVKMFPEREQHKPYLATNPNATTKRK